MKALPIIAIAGVVALVVIVSSLFIVDEREEVIVTQFGQVRAVKTEPGLAFKLPFIQEVNRYDARIQSLDTAPLEVTPLDDRRLVVESFARWRISDVERFRLAVGQSGDAALRSGAQRLERIVTAETRGVLGTVASDAILSVDRVALMARIRDAAFAEAQSLGIDVIDVRIKSAELPEQNLAATFGRMQAERQREAEDERARGREAATRIRSQAERTAVEIVSSAVRDAEIIRGEADAERNRVFAEAFGQDPEFFAFYRSLTAYERSLQGENSTLVISPDSQFFEYLQNDTVQPRN
ncbi:membrane protease subunit HflC [Rubricella aquisinus]|uniref:Protein HflC n=1 Tax=Rubricella aquisinus TaxID=2028108 RepID=A0A840X069_9RHOB|nr:protease modulator HflC [Rubricella aquisinus]MBB5516114.1 membrane protease subunit HflC [Rubricella aquisinus]